MVRSHVLVLSAALLPVISAFPANPQQQQPDVVQEKRPYHAPPVDRAQAVVDTFRLSWEGYYRFAFPNDELLPVTNTFGNSRYNQPYTRYLSMHYTNTCPAMDGVPQPLTRSVQHSSWVKRTL